MDQFLSRNLYRTLDFLQKINLLKPTSLNITEKELMFTTYFNLKEYYLAYYKLICKQSKKYIDEVVICNCCTKSINFMRNYALFMQNKNKSIKIKLCINEKETKNWEDLIYLLNEGKCIKDKYYELLSLNSQFTDYCDTNKNESYTIQYLELLDEYILYLIGMIRKDIRILEKVVRLNNLFWDAYLGIIDLCTIEYVPIIEGPLSNYFYMTLFVKKQISKYPYKLETTYPNLLGAVYYFRRDFLNTELVFRKIIQSPAYNLEYVDLYSNLQYINKNNEIYDLSHKSMKINKYRSETLSCIANTYSFKRDHIKAIEYYDMSIKMAPTNFLNYILLGHEYLEMKNYKKAIKAYTDGIKVCNQDYRGYYSIGKAYEMLNMYETSLFYYKKSIEYKNDDSIVWLSLGNIHILLKDYENGIRCFERSVKLKNVLGYLYIAEAYKVMKMYCESAEYYEKYVCGVTEKDEDIKKICVFLEEYYKKTGDYEKSKKYYELSKKI